MELGRWILDDTEKCRWRGLIVYCLLDRDFYGDDVLAARYKEAAARGLQLHIWSCRELENYLLVAPAIARLVTKRTKRAVTAESVGQAIDDAAARLKEELEDNIATRIQLEERGLTFKTAKSKARARLQVLLTSTPLHALVSGKDMLGLLSEWAQATYGVSFGAAALAREITSFEIPHELSSILRAIIDAKPFPNARGGVA